MTVRPLSRPYHQEPPRLVLILALASGAWLSLALVAAVVSLIVGRLL